MNEKLTLNDGTEIEGHIIESDTSLLLYLKNITLYDAFVLLNDPEKTKKIVAERYGQKTMVRGYKTLKAISVERGGMINATLTK